MSILTLVCKKCGEPLMKKGIHTNEKQRFQCSQCGFKSIEFDVVNIDDLKNIELNETIDGPDRNIVSTSSDIRTLEQLLKYCRVDLDLWEVKKHTVNSWGTKKNESFQVKAWMSQKVRELEIKDIKSVFEEFSKFAPTFVPIKRINKDFKFMAEVNFPDQHFGQLSWGEETGSDNYDMKISYDRMMDAAYYFYNILKDSNIDKILLIVGNDFYNVNSSANITAAGTPQNEDDRWKKTFTKGFELWIKVIDLLTEIADVEVKIVPGNHDQERVYYLGESIRAWYNKSENVNVDNSPQERKYYKWGKCLLGYTHGNKEVKGYLPQLMATEQPLWWSDTTWREWRTAHLHIQKQHIYQIVDEQQGVIITVVPSMTSIDYWHSSKGYGSIKKALLTIYDKDCGKYADYYYVV